jgi:hypothetical protein
LSITSRAPGSGDTRMLPLQQAATGRKPLVGYENFSRLLVRERRHAPKPPIKFPPCLDARPPSPFRSLACPSQWVADGWSDQVRPSHRYDTSTSTARSIHVQQHAFWLIDRPRCVPMSSLRLGSLAGYFWLRWPGRLDRKCSVDEPLAGYIVSIGGVRTRYPRVAYWDANRSCRRPKLACKFKGNHTGRHGDTALTYTCHPHR